MSGIIRIRLSLHCNHPKSPPQPLLPAISYIKNNSVEGFAKMMSENNWQRILRKKKKINFILSILQ